MNILIVDNDREYAEQLELMLRACAADHSELFTGETDINVKFNGREALYDIEDGSIHPDIIFIAIRVGRSNGIEIAGKMKESIPTAQIIFISDTGQYSPEIYDVEHVYLIEKPSSQEILKKALRKATNKISEENEYFKCVIKRRRHYLPYQDILYFENVKRKVTARTDIPGEEISFYETMANLEKNLPSNFARCHNSFIVNLDRISACGPASLMIGGKEIIISRKYKDVFRKRLGEREGR